MASQLRRHLKTDKIYGKYTNIVDYIIINLQILKLPNMWKIYSKKLKPMILSSHSQNIDNLIPDTAKPISAHFIKTLYFSALLTLFG